jgi:hypothetical protein
MDHPSRSPGVAQLAKSMLKDQWEHVKKKNADTYFSSGFQKLFSTMAEELATL